MSDKYILLLFQEIISWKYFHNHIPLTVAPLNEFSVKEYNVQ